MTSVVEYHFRVYNMYYAGFYLEVTCFKRKFDAFLNRGVTKDCCPKFATGLHSMLRLEVVRPRTGAPYVNVKCYLVGPGHM